MALFDFFQARQRQGIIRGQCRRTTARGSDQEGNPANFGLPGNINVQVEGSQVKVTGDVPDEATRQKLAMIVGNVKYIEAVDDSGLTGGGQTQAQARKPKVHEVQSGDTLSSIAKQHLGDVNAYRKIFEANRPMLSDPDEIYPGQVLIIPETTTATA